MDTSHLTALNVRLFDEKRRLASAKTDGEREIRGVWVAQLEKEIAGELAFLGLDSAPTMDEIMSDEELLDFLGE